MSATILVATPHAAFGELLRVSLTDSGQYQVHLVRSAAEAHAASESNTYHLAILDAALPDEPFIPLCMSVLDKQSGIRLIVIPPDNNPNHPSLGGLIPHGYLSRPFYLPDLIETVSHLLSHRDKQPQSSEQPEAEAAPGDSPSTTIPPWLQEPLMLRTSLLQEMMDTQAIAAIIGLSGAMRGWVGDLNDIAAQELIEVIFRHWNRADKTDLMRFVRLNTDKKDYLVYATHIIDELSLLLIFDTAAPLSQIRPQTKAMAHALASIPPADFSARSQPGGNATVYQPVTQPAADFQIAAQSSAPETAAPDRTGQNASETQPLNDSLFFNRVYNSFADPQFSNEKQPAEAETAPSQSSASESAAPPSADTGDFFDLDMNEEEEHIESGVINLTALLGSVPPPDPEMNDVRKPLFGSDWISDRSAGVPIPTLAGGYNGGSQEPVIPLNLTWDAEKSAASPGDASTDGASVHDASTDEASTNEISVAEQQLAQGTPDDAEKTREQRPVKKPPRTAPLDPQTLPRESLPAGPALPKDYAPSPYDQPINIADADFFQAVSGTPGSGRPATLDVKTEPPVTPPGVPAVIEPRQPTPTADLVPEEEDLPVPVDDIHPSVVSTITSLGQLEPASPALSLLNYTCVLVPRLPQHYLTGELADRMASWVQQLCLAFGWRLEGISIRPEYLQWTVQVAPAISPGNLVRIVRQRTSMHVFGTYPHLAEQNPSGDFWATGYLIVSGAQPPSAQLLRDYINQTRKRQGANK